MWRNVASFEYKSDGKRGSITQLSILPARDLKTECNRTNEMTGEVSNFILEIAAQRRVQNSRHK